MKAHDYKVHDYHEGNLELQERFQTTALADYIKTKRVTETVDDDQKKFIERANMFFLATCDHRGLPTCSYKGGDPGFVRVVNERTIAFPSYDGNGKYQSMGNLLKNPNVGILFVDFEGQERLRLQGVGSIIEDDQLLPDYPEAQFIVRVELTEVYVNCPRYVHKYKFVEASPFVPRAGQETPQPEWKTRGELKDLVPKKSHD